MTGTEWFAMLGWAEQRRWLARIEEERPLAKAFHRALRDVLKPEPRVWIVLRGLEDPDGIEVDVFESEEAAREHAYRLDSGAIVREESVAAVPWALEEQ